MGRTALVTGASGLLGRKVLQAFERTGWNAVGTGLSRAVPPVRKVDLLDHDAIESTLEEVK
jgi:NAD(P)-dependent dehydrogenase (short-subunit alcohol dehydrogenase family)